MGSFWPFFVQIWAKKNFPGKKGSVTFEIFQLSVIVGKIRKHLCAIPEKNAELAGECNGQTWNGRTDRQP